MNEMDYKMRPVDYLMAGAAWTVIITAIWNIDLLPAWMLAIFFGRNLAMGGG